MGSLVAGAAVASPFGGTPEPTYGPAPAPLDGPELPSFRYPLGSLPTKTFNGGTAKEANVTEFPVSEKLAGVYMTLDPGALRELHWHANAAEWAYVIDGRCRVTTIDPQNQCEIVDFGPGDVWYFPRGHGHSIQGLGPGVCTFVLVFDNGYFSEFGTFSITDWLGHTPAEVLAKNFDLPASTFADFPNKKVYTCPHETRYGTRGRGNIGRPTGPSMVFYVVTRKHSYTMKAYAQCWDGLRLFFYDDLFRATSLPVGAYIFTDLDRLTASERQLAAAVWQQLAAHTPRMRLLNDPARVLGRYELMCELASAGENHYRARRLTDGLDGLRYPVFIRCEREHDGSLTPLLHSSTAVRRALLWARVKAYRARDLLIVEFCDTSDAAGLFRKYSAFMVGDEVLPRHLLVGRKWHLKKPDLADVDTAREVQAYLERNPHEEAIRRIFRRASIDYGRIDYSMAGDQPQVWEINTNPKVRQLAERLTAAFARLNMGLSNDLLPIPIQLDSSLLTAAERESHREMRALHTRDRRRANVAGLVGFARPFRFAARLLRGC